MYFIQRDWLPITATLLATLASVLSYTNLPEFIPIHWGIDGRIDSYAPKKWGIFRYPGCMTFTYLFFRLIPYIDKGRIQQLKNIGIYDPFRNGSVIFFGYPHFLSIGIGIGWFSPDANFLIGGLSFLVLFAADHIRRICSPVCSRILGILGIAFSLPARLYLFWGLTGTGAFGLIGPLTGLIQVEWLLIPLFASLFLTRYRYPTNGDPSL